MPGTGEPDFTGKLNNYLSALRTRPSNNGDQGFDAVRYAEFDNMCRSLQEQETKWRNAGSWVLTNDDGVYDPFANDASTLLAMAGLPGMAVGELPDSGRYTTVLPSATSPTAPSNDPTSIVSRCLSHPFGGQITIHMRREPLEPRELGKTELISVPLQHVTIDEATSPPLRFLESVLAPVMAIGDFSANSGLESWPRPCDVQVYLTNRHILATKASYLLHQIRLDKSTLDRTLDRLRDAPPSSELVRRFGSQQDTMSERSRQLGRAESSLTDIKSIYDQLQWQNGAGRQWLLNKVKSVSVLEKNNDGKMRSLEDLETATADLLSTLQANPFDGFMPPNFVHSNSESSMKDNQAKMALLRDRAKPIMSIQDFPESSHEAGEWHVSWEPADEW